MGSLVRGTPWGPPAALQSSNRGPAGGLLTVIGRPLGSGAHGSVEALLSRGPHYPATREPRQLLTASQQGGPWRPPRWWGLPPVRGASFWSKQEAGLLRLLQQQQQEAAHQLSTGSLWHIWNPPGIVFASRRSGSPFSNGTTRYHQQRQQ